MTLVCSGDADHRPQGLFSLGFASREISHGKSHCGDNRKLVLAGAQAGFSVEQMIQLLQAGGSVETLLCLIELRLSPPTGNRSSRSVM